MPSPMTKLVVALGCSIIYPATTFGKDAPAKPEVCAEIAAAKVPIAILVDNTGAKSSGPIEIGRLAIPATTVSDGLRFPSTFRVVIAPASIQARNLVSLGYSVRLEKALSVCPKSATYRANLYMAFKGRGVRPYKFEEALPDLFRVDQYGFEKDESGAYQFDARVLGELVEPQPAKDTKQ